MIFKKDDLEELNLAIQVQDTHYIVSFEEKSLEYLSLALKENSWQEAKNLVIESINDEQENEVICQSLIYDKNVIYFELNSERKAKKLKIYFKENVKFDIQELKIYTRKYPGLLCASRADGLGARFMPILNALVLAKMSGFKFGYTWHAPTWLLEAAKLQKVDDNKLSCLFTGYEDEVFHQDFIEKYSYTKVLPWDRGNYKKMSLEQMKTAKFDQTWGYFISESTAQNVLDMKEAGKYYPEAFKQIKFSQKIQQTIDLALSKIPKEPFIAIQIRTGDIVYRSEIRKVFVDYNLFKAMPMEIGLELAEQKLKQNYKIILFGDDFTSLKIMKAYINNPNFHFVEDFLEGEDLDDLQRNFFDVIFMSRAKEIYSGISSLARFASYVGLGKEPSFYYEFLDNEQMYEIVKKNIDKMKLHKFQRAYSLYFLYNLGKKLKSVSKEENFNTINLCRSIDEQNPLYFIPVLMYYLQNKEYEKAKSCLKNIKGFDPSFFNFYLNPQSLIYKESIEFFKQEFDFECEEFVYFKQKILPNYQAPKTIKPKGAVLRVQNHLAYKLGQAMMLNCKSFVGYIRMPYVLSFIKEQHKKSKKTTARLPDLKEYEDYKEALKIQNYFSYKLGEALIKRNKEASSNIFKFIMTAGGTLTFLFKDLLYLKNKVKKDKK